MCCWNTNKKLIEHKYETGQDVIYNGQQAMITEVFPVETGVADYSVYANGKTVRVREDQLVAVEVDAYALVNR